MKLLSDYILFDSWQEKELNMEAGKKYQVLADIGQLKSGTEVTLHGFSDIDNHYGVLVFKNDANQPLEVGGDYSSKGHSIFATIRAAIREKATE